MNGLETLLDWLTRLALQCQEPLGGRNIGTMHLCTYVPYAMHLCTIPFIDHLLEEMSSRFSEDNRAGPEMFSLVPSNLFRDYFNL